MAMIQIVTATNEVNASIIKGVLESNGIKASYAPNTGRNGHVARCTVYCQEDKVEEALKLLREEGLIDTK